MTNSVSPGSLTVILEDQNIADAMIPLKIDDAGYVGSDNVRDFPDF
jgi:hypothetical protein